MPGFTLYAGRAHVNKASCAKCGQHQHLYADSDPNEKIVCVRCFYRLYPGEEAYNQQPEDLENALRVRQ